MIFVGIENANEFFTQHYLTAILAGDLRPVLERWRLVAKEAEPTDGGSSSRSALVVRSGLTTFQEWPRSRDLNRRFAATKTVAGSCGDNASGVSQFQR